MSKRVIAFVAAGLFLAGTLAGCAQLLGIEELSPGEPIDAMPSVDPDGGPPMETCAIDNGGCDPNADCFETPEGRVCECRRGFIGDGLACTMPWELVTTITDRAFYNGFGAYAVGSGTRLYFFPESNDPPPSSFFLSYDVYTGDLQEEVLPPPESNDFCACGLGQVLVALDDYLYQFGNYGMRYHTILRTWEQVFYPPEHERGEAAAAVLGRRIYTFGGRSAARSVQYFDVDMNAWMEIGPTLPWDLDDGAAVAVEPNQIYVFGGRVDGVPDRAAVYDLAANEWQPLPNMPEALGSPRGTGVVSGKPFVVSFGSLHAFDPGSGTWITIPLPELAYGYAATIGDEVYIVGALEGQTQIYHLVDIPPGPDPS